MIQRTSPVLVVGDAMAAASRQVWLAGLGAAVVTREWAGKEAATMFRNLVREGTAVESRAFRIIGDRLESSFVNANTLWKFARHSVTKNVRAYADGAATLVREALPASLPIVGKKRASVKAKRASSKGTVKRAVKAVKRGQRATQRRSQKRA